MKFVCVCLNQYINKCLILMMTLNSHEHVSRSLLDLSLNSIDFKFMK